MKKNNHKGFTITELVIVIAVIAILAAVLIPTFSGVITKANKSAAVQEARNDFTDYMIDHAEEGPADLVIEAEGYYFTVINGVLDVENLYDDAETAQGKITVPTGKEWSEADANGIYTIVDATEEEGGEG